MPATLTNDRFELQMSVAGYEFPDILDNPYDANWLLIRLGLQSLHGAWNWQVIDAGALTWELADCVTWLQLLSSNHPVEDEHFGFSEPDIRFEAIRNEENVVVGLFVNLMDEFQPPTKVLKPYEQNIATLRFHAPSHDLQQFASDLAEELEMFPQRGERPSEARNFPRIIP